MHHRLATILLIALLLAPLTVQAQGEPPIKLDVRAGYDDQGRYRTNQWFPISIVATNSSNDITGVLEWRFPAQRDEGGVFQREVSLPRGANKRFSLAAFSRSFARNGELRLLVDGNEVLRQPVQLEPADPNQFMVGVLSSDPALLNSLGSMTLGGSSGTQVNHLDPTLLPEDATTLLGLDTIFVHDIATAQLSAPQRDALAQWVRLGGQLVVSGGTSADSSAGGLAELLPVELTGLAPSVSLAGLGALSDTAAGAPPAGVTVSTVRLRAGAEPLEPNGLLVGWAQGMGRVIFSTFDLGALRGWQGEQDVWGETLEQEPRFLPGVTQRDTLLQNQSVLQLPVLGLPGFGALLAFVLIYILVIGPLNYLVLQRLRRPELAWLSIPLTVLVFVVATYTYGLTTRGGQPQVSQLTLVQAVEGQGSGQATAFVGLFSPRRATYTLRFPPEALVSEANSFESGALDAPVRWTDGGTDVPEALVDVSSLRAFVFEQAVDVPAEVESSLRIAQRSAEGSLTYRGAEPLEDALLVWGDSAQQLGTLARGASVQLSLRADRGNFPNGNLAGDTGVFNRRNVLAMLFGNQAFGAMGPGGFQAGLPDRDGVYLLGWVARPSVPVQLNGADAPQQGTTLYIVRLNAQATP
jgi:hypothetical protein